MIKRLLFNLIFTATAIVVIAVWTIAAPVIFAWHVAEGAGRGFWYAGFIMRTGYLRTIKNYLEGLKTL